jgi:hypothetical protein
MENLFPNGGLGYTGPGAKFASWTNTLTGSGTVPVSTYSATSGPDSTPGVTYSCTGASGGVSAVSPKFNVPADSGFLVVAVTLKASNTANSLLVPVSVAFSDASGNAVQTWTPLASAAAASTSAILYSYCVACPVGSATAVVTLGAYSWTSTGGYTLVMSSPAVLVA